MLFAEPHVRIANNVLNIRNKTEHLVLEETPLKIKQKKKIVLNECWEGIYLGSNITEDLNMKKYIKNTIKLK